MPAGPGGYGVGWPACVPALLVVCVFVFSVTLQVLGLVAPGFCDLGQEQQHLGGLSRRARAWASMFINNIFGHQEMAKGALTVCRRCADDV